MNAKNKFSCFARSSIVSLLFLLFATALYGTIDVANVGYTSGLSCSGSIEVIADGTAGPFSITLSKVEGTNNVLIEEVNDILGTYLFNGLCEGSYVIEVLNSLGCVVELNTAVLNCDDFPIILSGEVSNMCFGNIGGAINLDVSGGTNENFSFVWSNGGITQNIDGLQPGTYCVTVTDEAACMAEACFDVENNVDPNFAIQLESITCVCPNGWGLIDITVTGNSGPYHFEWLGAGNYYSEDEDAYVTESGHYTINVYNSYECVLSSEFDLETCSFDFNSFNVNITNSCQGPNSGSIYIATGGGAEAPYYFVWETTEGDNIANNSTLGYDVVDDLSAGEYCVTITSANGCEAAQCDLIINEYPEPDISYTVAPASSPSASDGAIDLHVSGAGGNVTYLWSTGATTQDVSGLIPGQYLVNITYEDGNCVSYLQIEVGTCNDLNGDLQVTAEVIPMAGDNYDGAINLDVENVDGYELVYSWLGSNTGLQYNTQDISGLGPDIYCVTITNPNCQQILSTLCYEICGFGLEVNIGRITYCNYAQIDALVTGVNGPYTYQWSNGFSSPGIIAFYGQEYCVTVTDNTGCTASLCETITIPEMELSFDVTNTTLGAAEGAITVNVINDLFPPFNYNWDNGMTGQTISGLYAGDYCVTVTDNCGETISGCATVECEITSNEVNVDITNTSCGLESNGGAIDLTVYNDVGYNTYNWSNGATTEDINGLAAGEYCVTVVNYPTDCQYTDCYTIETDGNGSFHIGFDTEPSCTGGNDGSITANVTGGVGPYTYVWTKWDFWTGIETVGYEQTLNDVGSGWYAVHVTDALGCTDSNYLLFWPSAPTIDYDIELSQDIVCEGETADASITNITGGVAPYSIEWRKLYQVIGTGPTVTDLEPAWYFTKVTDAEGCQREKSFQVAQAPDIEYQSIVKNTCQGMAAGAITLEYTGNYSFQWSNGQNSSILKYLPEGWYCVTITDTHGCTEEECFIIESDFLDLTAETVQHNVCDDGCEGSIDLEVTASSPVIYTWSNGATSQDLDNLCQGGYSVTITAGGCTIVKSYTIESEAAFEYEVLVERHFNHEESPDGSAKVYIISDNFSAGMIEVSTSPQMNPIIFSGPASGNDARIYIPIEYNDTDPFYFRYLANNGCIYEGSFGGIPTCVPEEIFSFGVEHVGDDEGFCGTGQQHSYIVTISGPQVNPPYYIKVTMDEADPTEIGYEQTVSNTGQNPIQIDGVPAGTVRFEYFNNCSTYAIKIRTHENCCQDISCEILSEGYDGDVVGDDDDNYFYNLDFVQLYVRDLCLDTDCGGWGNANDCSEIVPELNTYPPVNNCWFGTVTIDYPSGPDAIFTVSPDVDDDGQNVYDEVEWVAEENWNPSSPGTYTVTITYDGDDNIGSGTDCEIILEIDFFGPGNYQQSIVFRDDYWFPDDWYPEGSMEAYYGANNCQMCGGDDLYLFDRSDCDEELNYTFTFFNFVPLDYDDPCNSGGFLTILDFDDDGQPEIQSVLLVPPYSAEAEFPGLQAFNAPENQWCSNSGWCHFDGDAIYGINEFNGRPILATWFEPGSCEDEDDPEVPPCNDETNPCIFGDCVNGECVENNDDCFPLCPAGFVCIDNDCVLQDGEQPCNDDCDCPIGQYCNNGNCYDFPSQYECTPVDGGGSCQCPENYECINGFCELVENCNNCGPNEYCDNNQCTACPMISASFCYEDATCGITTDCVLEITLISTPGIPPATIQVFRNFVMVNSYNLSINSTRVLYETVPCGGQNYFYQVFVTFDECPVYQFDAPFQANCGDPCFDGGDPENENFSSTSNTINSDVEVQTENEQNFSYPSVVKSETISSSRCLVYPNPFKDLINIEYKAEEQGVIEVMISDIYGRKIQNRLLDVFSGANQMEVRLNDNIPVGIYFILVTNEKGESEIFKLLHSKL